jgi:hypothetical protein
VDEASNRCCKDGWLSRASINRTPRN